MQYRLLKFKGVISPVLLNLGLNIRMPHEDLAPQTHGHPNMLESMNVYVST